MSGGPELLESTLTSLQWRCIGPHRGGRVVAVAGCPRDPMTFYFGACAGGMWKSTDGGLTWSCITDGSFTTAAIGALAIAPSNSNVIYAGTGEACIRNDVSHGDGVYRSRDAGKTWTHVGLRDTRHIGRILVHPHDPNTVYTAALGHAWGPNDERGVFRSRDGGESWTQILFKSPRAGSHDIAMDPLNPAVLYAPIWQAQRFPHALVSGGEECGLWRSIRWRRLRGGDQPQARPPEGLARQDRGRCFAQPVGGSGWGRSWALVEAEDGALFRSDDGGERWDRASRVFGPADPALVLHACHGRPGRPGHRLRPELPPVEVDRRRPHFPAGADAAWRRSRALDRSPEPTRMIEGNDGGACVSFNAGQSWSSIYNQPTAQLYHVTTDDAVSVPRLCFAAGQHRDQHPERFADRRDHRARLGKAGGGESGYIALKPDDNAFVVASGPAGRRFTNDVMYLHDRRTGQDWQNTVWPELYGWGLGAEGLRYRLNWTFPIHFSRHDPDVLWVASQFLHRSTDKGASWEAMSEDLTRNDPWKLGPWVGRSRATIRPPRSTARSSPWRSCRSAAIASGSALTTALSIAPTMAGGLVDVTPNGRNAKVTGEDALPDGADQHVEPSPHDADTPYVRRNRTSMTTRAPTSTRPPTAE